MRFNIRRFFYLFLVMLVTLPSLVLFAERSNKGNHRRHHTSYNNKYFRDNYNYYGHPHSWGGWNDRYWGSGRNHGVGTGSYYRPYYNDYHSHSYGYTEEPIYDYDTTYYFVIPK